MEFGVNGVNGLRAINVIRNVMKLEEVSKRDVV